MQQLLFLAISLLASVAGAICGIGGGVIIKPVLDTFGLASVSTISFLSGCTVLSMSAYSVGKGLLSRDSAVDLKSGTYLAVGAAAGGICGQQLFALVRSLFADQNTVGAVQAACLFVVTLGTLLYTIFKARIRTIQVQGVVPGVVIGMALGIMSSFLGIGGGPINLVVLGYFFSMQTKTAAQNSLYIILFSQITSLLTTVVAGNVPEFEPLTLVLMVAGGIGGGMIGRFFSRRMDDRMVDKLFIGLMVVIMAICVWNTVRYSGLA